MAPGLTFPNSTFTFSQVRGIRDAWGSSSLKDPVEYKMGLLSLGNNQKESILETIVLTSMNYL